MTRVTVTTQTELDAAIEAHGGDRHAEIVIDSPRGVWLYLATSGSATVRAYGSATVWACGSATVRAYDSATVRAYDSATVQAYGSATVRAYGSTTVRAYDSATVEACDSATVRACDSATVRASGSATARAYELAAVRAYDSATVQAYDSATVQAYGSATVEASTYVAVHLHSAHATITGGVVIDVTALDLTDPATWADYTGATITDGTVTLYKAVDDNLDAGHNYLRTHYPVGQDVTAPDWRDDNKCGGGLHASPHPWQARDYYPGSTRMLEVSVPLADLRPIPGGTAKAKARTVHVVREVALPDVNATGEIPGTGEALGIDDFN